MGETGLCEIMAQHKFGRTVQYLLGDFELFKGSIALCRCLIPTFNVITMKYVTFDDNLAYNTQIIEGPPN